MFKTKPVNKLYSISVIKDLIVRARAEIETAKQWESFDSVDLKLKHSTKALALIELAENVYVFHIGLGPFPDHYKTKEQTILRRLEKFEELFDIPAILS